MQALLTSIWNGFAVFVAVSYLADSLWKGLIVGAFALISGVLGFSRRWVFAAGFAASVFGIAVFLGFPHPRDWSAAMRSPAFVDATQAILTARRQ